MIFVKSKKPFILLGMICTLLIGLIGIGAVAFITLLERKVLGITQVRLGPNKVSFRGVLQPVADGVKLLTKQNTRTKLRHRGLFRVRPCLLIGLYLLLWRSVTPWEGGSLNKHSLLLFFSLLGVGAYAVILTGWSSTRRFSKLGSLRGVLQRLSYEVALILVFLYFIILVKNYNFTPIRVKIRKELLIFWVALWLILALIETNRAPFDLLEGERELIRGFNIEIGRLMFVYLFLREYGILIIISIVSDLILTGGVGLIRLLFIRLFLLFRSCYPRLKYDSLIRIIWQSILPIRALTTYWVYF